MVTRRGQALMELAVGMFALALVVSALCVVAHYAVRSLEIQNSLRKNGSSGSDSDSIEVGGFAAANFTGSETLKIHDKVEMPPKK